MGVVAKTTSIVLGATLGPGIFLGGFGALTSPKSDTPIRTSMAGAYDTNHEVFSSVITDTDESKSGAGGIIQNVAIVLRKTNGWSADVMGFMVGGGADVLKIFAHRSEESTEKPQEPKHLKPSAKKGAHELVAQ